MRHISLLTKEISAQTRPKCRINADGLEERQEGPGYTRSRTNRKLRHPLHVHLPAAPGLYPRIRLNGRYK
jgi:hypothetical protein